MQVLRKKILIALVLSAAFFLTCCTSKFDDNSGGAAEDIDSQIEESTKQSEKVTEDLTSGTAEETSRKPTEETAKPTEETDNAENTVTVDYEVVKPDESGKIMVVMFHNFIKEYSSGDWEWTTTFRRFRLLLEKLYEKNYRLVSMSDYYNNNISVPAGCIPMVFTFDDGTSGQFNLINDNNELCINPESAVGVMEEFNKEHADFGMEGLFYLNLGLGVFPGEGSVEERLKLLIDKGFEIGNHTMTHANLGKDVNSAQEIQKEIGGNNRRMSELVEGYHMKHLSLPYGAFAPEKLTRYVSAGVYQGIPYENLTVAEVGWDPAPSPVHKDFDPLKLHRVRAPGIKSVNADLDWWLERLSREEQYVSDGDPLTVAIPKSREKYINREAIAGKKLIVY